jgi:hypothetical protein
MALVKMGEANQIAHLGILNAFGKYQAKVFHLYF